MSPDVICASSSVARPDLLGGGRHAFDLDGGRLAALDLHEDP